jgi:putative ABC transport system permease protein
MDALAIRLEALYPVSNQDVRFRLQPLAESVTSEIRPALMLLVATVGCVLLIACVNAANLMIARGAARRTGLVIRAALGASPARLAGALLAESVVLAAAGGALGLAMSYWIVQAVIRLAPPGISRLDASRLDLRVLGFTAALAMITGLAFGLWPAWRAQNAPRRSYTMVRPCHRRWQPRSNLLWSSDLIALTLVIGAGALLRSLSALVNQPLGWNRGLIGLSPLAASVISTSRAVSNSMKTTSGPRSIGARCRDDDPIARRATGFSQPRVRRQADDAGRKARVYYRANDDYLPCSVSR